MCVGHGRQIDSSYVEDKTGTKSLKFKEEEQLRQLALLSQEP